MDDSDNNSSSYTNAGSSREQYTIGIFRGYFPKGIVIFMYNNHMATKNAQ